MPDQRKKALRAINISENGDTGIILELNSLDDRIDYSVSLVDSKAEKAISMAEAAVKMEGKPGYTPIKGIDYDDGKPGENYVITDEDKKEIASIVEVPVVEKLIEKTERIIREIPIVTENVVEKAVADSPEVTAEKLNTLKGAVDVSVIRGAVARKDLDDQDRKVLSGMAEIDGRIKLIDQRWGGHGGGSGGLKSVCHDSSLLGLGTPASPLEVNPAIIPPSVAPDPPNHSFQTNCDGVFTSSGLVIPASQILSLGSGNTCCACATVAGFNNSVTNCYSVANGYCNTVSGYCASAYGINNTASAGYAAALGFTNTASGYSSNAIGSNNCATGLNSAAVGVSNCAINGSFAGGTRNTSSGTYSTTSGYSNTVCSGTDSSTALGSYNIVTGRQATAIGTDNTAGGIFSGAFGGLNAALGDYSTASGYCNLVCSAANGSSAFGNANVVACGEAFAAGSINNVRGQFSSAFGYNNCVTGARSSASGYYNTARADQTTASGYANTASGYRSAAIGFANITGSSAQGSTSSGSYNQALGVRSSAIGSCNTASGYYSSAIGSSNIADNTSAAIGYQNTANSNSSAFGYRNIASKNDSTAIGYSNTASGYYSTASGYCNNATGDCSASIGYCNTSTNRATNAIGFCNTVSGYSAFASGSNNNAGGDYSYASGYNSSSSGYLSFAAGYRNTASCCLSTAIGACLTNSTPLSAMVGYCGQFIQTTSTGLCNTIGYKSTDGSNGICAVSGGFTFKNGILTAGSLASVCLTTGVTGVLPIANGGTNASSQTACGIAYFDGAKIATSSSNQWDDAGKIQTTAGTISLKQATTLATILGDVTGNARGASALDIQACRTAVTQVASGAGAVAYGAKNTSSGAGSVTLGVSNNACSSSGASLVGVNNSIVSAGGGEVLFGTNNTSKGGNSNVAVGGGNIMQGTFGTGVNTFVGNGNVDTGSSYGSSSATLVGKSNKICADALSNILLAGVSNCAYASCSVALGNVNIVSGQIAFASGIDNCATNMGAAAIGSFNTASGCYALAIGNQNLANGYRGIAIGAINSASGSYASSAIGYQNTSSGYGSTASGYNNTASGCYSAAFGTCLNNATACSTMLGIGANTVLVSAVQSCSSVPINTAGYTVASLPSGVLGMRAYVTDALAPTFLGVLTGGGATKAPVFYDGSGWKVG